MGSGTCWAAAPDVTQTMRARAAGMDLVGIAAAIVSESRDADKRTDPRRRFH